MKKTILLVEDSKIQKLASERILLKAGYLVLFAADGEEGLRLARESVPDVILLDLVLPGIAGEEVLYSLKRDARTEQIPVIIVSQVAPAQSAHLKAIGAADYFEKSRFLEEVTGEAAFLAMINRVLRQAGDRSKAESKGSAMARHQGASG
jgi:twitching motility two-component system response regulator PilH